MFAVRVSDTANGGAVPGVWAMIEVLALVIGGLWVAAMIEMLISNWRHDRCCELKLCLKCGYPTEPTDGRCPECGSSYPKLPTSGQCRP